ncbi:MAG: F0F1 ATP synthase subunit delta, partial [Fusobacteriaceae bacterium]
KLSKSTGKKVNLEVEVDASLIAGGIIRIGDKVIDGSVKTKLNEMGKAE